MGKNRNWTKEEEEQLFREYPWRSSEVLAEEMDRTINAINLKASRLGLSKPFIVKDPDDMQLLRCWGKDFDSGCVDRCPGWLECLEKYSRSVKEELELEYNLKKITVKAPTTAEAIIQAIRRAK